MSRGDGARRSWADPEIRARRIEAIRKAWDDPLRLAMARYAAGMKTGRRASQEAYNAYFRAYLKKWRRGKARGHERGSD
jgi:hypothetical protein